MCLEEFDNVDEGQLGPTQDYPYEQERPSMSKIVKRSAKRKSLGILAESIPLPAVAVASSFPLSARHSCMSASVLWDRLWRETRVILGSAGGITTALWIKRLIEKLSSQQIIDKDIVEHG
jgi:hypothetical protein